METEPEQDRTDGDAVVPDDVRLRRQRDHYAEGHITFPDSNFRHFERRN